MLVCRPLSGDLVVTSPFGPRVIAGVDGVHRGVDYRAPVGSILFAPASSTVTKINDTTAGGLQLFLRSDDGRELIAFSHLSDVAVGVGQHVEAGDPIAQTGDSGFILDAAGRPIRRVSPHLHTQLQVVDRIDGVEVVSLVDPDARYQPLPDPASVGSSSSSSASSSRGGVVVVVVGALLLLSRLFRRR